MSPLIRVLGDEGQGFILGTEDGDYIDLEHNLYQPTSASPNWQPKTFYYSEEVKSYNRIDYRALANHTSTESFKEDYLTSGLWVIAGKAYSYKAWKPKTLYAQGTAVLLGYIQLVSLFDHESGTSILEDLDLDLWDFLPQRHKLLSEHILDDLFYGSLVEELDRYLIENVDILYWKLSQLRSFSQDTELEVLKRTSALLGFDLSNYLLGNSSDLYRFINHISKFRYESGKPIYADFIGFLLGGKFSVTELWSQDHITFVPKTSVPLDAVYAIQQPTNPLAWYKTNHVAIEFNMSSIWSRMEQVTRTAIATTLEQLFYDFSPIATVIHSLTLGVEQCVVAQLFGPIISTLPIPSGSINLNELGLKVEVNEVVGSVLQLSGTLEVGATLTGLNVTTQLPAVVEIGGGVWSSVFDLIPGINKIYVEARQGSLTQTLSLTVTI